MKVFEVDEKVDGLVPCRKKPLVVRSKEMNEPFRVNSLEGDYAQGKVGDYLMCGIEGELYICDRNIYNKTYEQV
ncbi:MAG: hypothetical protein DRQ78_07530 [Epsilonproteobacteria bacterium]|nr:MAG: hypothetical protein DRQ78_07530 [Campylobacterota bacterium]